MRETERLSARGERSRRRTVSVPTICRYTVSAEGGRKKKREKKNLESSSSARCRPLVISSSAGDFFSLRGEKERGNVHGVKLSLSLELHDIEAIYILLVGLLDQRFCKPGPVLPRRLADPI
ncbi:hypothetical protein BHE74_00002271 [Ensete ventricosum]|nr:hypothetical protein BHE74_00002271 [Ensete ventricosum]